MTGRFAFLKVYPPPRLFDPFLGFNFGLNWLNTKNSLNRPLK